MFFFSFFFFLFSFNVTAQSPRWESPEIGSRSAVVMDAATGTIVFNKNPDMEIPPASLTKLMTMRIAFKEIAAGRASPDEIIIPGRESWARNQLPMSSLMFLAPGQQLSLHELFLGLAIFSGNDAATAVALRFAPSVESFVDMMNREAAALGLARTRFADASGYSEFSMTTAREFAEFCRIYLEAHPESLAKYHSVRDFSYPMPEHVAPPYRANPGTKLQRNRNTLLGRVDGVDGLKTGFINESGYNIALTAERKGTRFIAVVMGAPSDLGGERIRDEDGARLLDWAFASFKTIRLAPQSPEPARVWKGMENYVELSLGAPLVFTSLAERGEGINFSVELEDPIIAPLAAGTPVGNLVVSDSLGELRKIPLLTAAEMEQGGFWKRLFDGVRLFFRRG